MLLFPARDLCWEDTDPFPERLEAALPLLCGLWSPLSTGLAEREGERCCLFDCERMEMTSDSSPSLSSSSGSKLEQAEVMITWGNITMLSGLSEENKEPAELMSSGSRS